MKAMKKSAKKSAMKSGMKSAAKKPSAMKRKAMRVSKIGKKASVFRGGKEKTVGGLKKTDLKKNKNGKVVSKKASDAAKKRKSFSKIVKWGAAFKQARKALGIKGFC